MSHHGSGGDEACKEAPKVGMGSFARVRQGRKILEDNALNGSTRTCMGGNMTVYYLRIAHK